MQYRVLLFILIAVGAIGIGIVPSIAQLKILFSEAGLLVVCTTFLLWCFRLLTVYGKKLNRIFKKHAAAFFFSLAVMGLIFMFTPPRFKVFSDETNLVNVSKSIYFEMTPKLCLEKAGIGPSEDIIHREKIDKRPLLFPFLLTIIHHVTGYSPHNSFLLNFIAGSLILFAVYLIISRYTTVYWGIIAILLFAGLPILGFYVTSGGFEVLNLFFILFSIIALQDFLKQRSFESAELFFLSLILTAHVRYESVLIVFGIIPLFSKFINKKMISTYTWITFLTPLLLTPILWQQRIVLNPDEIATRLQFDDIPQGVQAFGIGNLMENVPKNLMVLSGFDPVYGYSPLISLMALAGAYLACRRSITAPGSIPNNIKSIVYYGGTSFALLFCVSHLYFLNRFFHPMTNRLSFVFIPCMIFPALYFLFVLSKNFKRIGRGVLFFVLLAHIFLLSPYTRSQELLRMLAVAGEYHQIMYFISADYKNDKILLISDRPYLFVIHDMDAVYFKTANKYKKSAEKSFGDGYDHVLALQKYNSKFTFPYMRTRFEGDLHLKPLRKIPITPNTYIIVSEVQGI